MKAQIFYNIIKEEINKVFSELAVGPPMKGVFGGKPKFEIGDKVRWQGEVYTIVRIERAKATGKPYYVLRMKPGSTRLKVVTSAKELEPIITEQQSRRGELGRVIYTRGRGFSSQGKPLTMLRGRGAEQLKSVLTKRYGFQWNPDSYAWESYLLDRNDLENLLRKIKLLGYEIKER